MAMMKTKTKRTNTSGATGTKTATPRSNSTSGSYMKTKKPLTRGTQKPMTPLRTGVTKARIKY